VCTLPYHWVWLEVMTIAELLQIATERARQLGLPYRGALTPTS
jgi:hypothetical protein